MKVLIFAFLLICFVESNAELTQHNKAQKLHISEELAARINERIKEIDRLQTNYASYYPILSNVFLKERGYKIGCEVGVFTAGHAKFILANSAVEKLYCIDSYIAPMNSETIITTGFDKSYWQACWDAMYYYAVGELSAFRDRIEFMRLSSEKASTIIADHSLDFIFIDADHSYKGVFADCTNYYDKVRSGGMIAGDDYHNNSVEQAVQDFFKKKNLVINVYPGQKRFWWVEKP